MTPSNEPLSNAALDRFHSALRHAGAPLGDEIGPGLSDAEIDRLGKRLAVAVPPELRTLWSWGTSPRQPTAAGSWDINAQFELWPPDVAIKQIEGARLDEAVSRTALAFGGSQDLLLLIEGGATNESSPVVLAPIDDPSTLRAAPSLGALFNLWTDQLSSGDYRYVNGEWAPVDGPRPWIRDVS